ncbi:hypothetical protein D9758_008853 [Tetrapyrgos nigripes]|uniref:non-specific serine/threonine protein kinase n=1 Tax=Tetrapyrgos nigripes TaxID=182062 RepID=A0A8H5CLV1_9AGAR|nr:hypothetical protein D9758_008853 [Tetrapyrgos nigripes]
MPRGSPSDSDSMPNFSGFLLDNRFKLLDLLGSGAYGRVYKAVDLSATPKGSCFFAVKCLQRPPSGSRREIFQIRECSHQLLVSDHPNIVTLHKVFQDHNHIYVVLDFCIGGDLFSAINPKNIFFRNDALVKSTFLQILDAVDYCHQRNVYHRDLKPENILCSEDYAQVFIADFGLSTQTRASKEFRCGSAFYMSPENLSKDLLSYSTRCNDIWSLGVILTNMLTGRNPWRLAVPVDPCFNAFRNNRDFLRTVLPISEEANAILKRIFHFYPNSRIHIRDLKQEISAAQTFFMSDEELRAASEAVRKVAEFCGAVLSLAQSSPVQAISPEPESSDGSAKQVVILATPATPVSPNNWAQGSSSGSEDDSKGPVTPETRPVQPVVEVPDLEEEMEQQIVRTPVIQFHPASPHLDDGPRHRAPSSSASKPPPRRAGTQLFKKAVRRLKRLSEPESLSS